MSVSRWSVEVPEDHFAPLDANRASPTSANPVTHSLSTYFSNEGLDADDSCSVISDVRYYTDQFQLSHGDFNILVLAGSRIVSQLAALVRSHWDVEARMHAKDLAPLCSTRVQLH